jgi:CPA2 family monovalent cation:H+ antiporter-2
MTVVQTMRSFGHKGYFGDPTRPDLLKAAGIDKAKVLVVAVDDHSASVKLVKYARQLREDLHIVARARDEVSVYELYEAGADDIVREMFDSSLRAGRYVLENLGFSEYEAAEAEDEFYHHDRASLKELAALWKPGIPIEKNADYSARVKELYSELEAALAARQQRSKEATRAAPDEKAEA